MANKGVTEIVQRTSRTERMGYWMYFLGQNIFYGVIALNIQIFYSDVGITAAAVAVILLITKAWDAINDPLFGVLIDKIRFKKGRFLPWLRIATPAIALSSIIMFALPTGAEMTVRIVWVTIAYIAWDMSYTLCDVPLFVLPTTMTDNIKERTSILSIARFTALIGAVIAMIGLPILQSRLGWFACGLIFSVLGALFMLPLIFKGKEHNVVRPEKEVTLKQMFRYVAGNKYLLIFYLGMFISSLTNFVTVVNIFFARYNLGNQDMASLISMITLAPMLLVGAFIPALIKRVDKYYLYICSQALAAVLGVARYLVGYSNLTAFYVLAVLYGIFAGANAILVFMFTPDCLEYGTYHTGERAEGVAASVQTFATKLIGSVTGPLAMLILAAAGFVSGENAVQPQSAIDGIWLCYTILPSIGIVVSLLALRFYKLRDKDVQVMSQYNSGQITKEEVDELLSAKHGPAAILTKMTVTSD